jgi:hypothetical protein
LPPPAAPEAAETPPDAPDDATLADCNVTLPEPLLSLAPLVTVAEPPVRTPRKSPAATYSDPDAPDVDAPTTTLMAPPRPEVLLPLATKTAPEFALAAPPDDSCTEPLSPETVDNERTDVDPDPSAPSPLLTLTSPPP